MMKNKHEIIPISQISIPSRIRKETGNLTTLMQSIQNFGLIHPVLVDTNNNLIAGYRRLAAIRQLGYEMIEIRRIDIKNRKLIIALEIEENLHRKDFLESELEEGYQRLAKEEKRINNIFFRFFRWIISLFKKRQT